MNIIIFGTGSTARFFLDSLKEDVNILAFADNDLSKVGCNVKGIIVIDPNHIPNYSYNYIIIASQFNKDIFNQLLSMGIKKDKIFQFFKFLDLNYNYLKLKLENYKKDRDFSIVATGLSYSEHGLKIEEIKKKAFSFANGSQDLYYDYKVIEFIINTYGAGNIEHVIISMCYYSFQYDLSLSSMSDKVSIYYSVLHDGHNHEAPEVLFDEFNLNADLASRFIKKNENGRFALSWPERMLSSSRDSAFVGRNQAEIDCNKNYPNTVKENIQIFQDYLMLLKKYNIKPIVLVFPASKYYTRYFSQRIEEEFHLIISEVRKEYDFQYIDYFRSDLFDDEDFADVSHLNIKGAEKFTKILNEIIKW